MGLVVGRYGRILRTVNGGLVWSRVASPTTAHLVRAVVGVALVAAAAVAAAVAAVSVVAVVAAVSVVAAVAVVRAATSPQGPLPAPYQPLTAAPKP